MKRWNAAEMLTIGKKLFVKIHQQKYTAHHNHDIHFMARELADDWLPKGIQSLINGSYVPRCLKRHYFADEMVDQLHLSDRILQHLLLKELKATFQHVMHVMNKNCYHLQGPSGVKRATRRIRQVLEDEKPNYILRVDVKSYYKSIPHFKLLQDIKKYYVDPKVQAMLEQIIINPIETPKGYRNPDQGIALRGPLSQFVLWWQKTADVWQYVELLQWFMESCRAPQPKAVAAALLQVATLRRIEASTDCRTPR